MRTPSIRRIAPLLLTLCTTANAVVERYKDQAAYLARLSELGYSTLTEGFEGSDWDHVRSNYPTQNAALSVTSQKLKWDSASGDLWPYIGTVLITTNANWARSGNWGAYDTHIVSSLRVTTPEPIYAIGFWVNTNPDSQDVGILFEDRNSATEPGYVVNGFGAMYPGDIHPTGHGFVGFVDTDGFTSVVITGTLEVNEEGVLEGGTVYGADDFSFGVAASFFRTTVENWRLSYFTETDLNNATLEASLWGTSADPDEDGLTNDLELALGAHPLDPSSGPSAVSVATATASGQELLEMSFLRRNDDPDLTITAELSADLAAPWIDEATAFDTIINTDQSNGYNHVTLRAKTNTPPRTKAFGRIRVTRSLP